MTVEGGERKRGNATGPEAAPRRGEKIGDAEMIATIEKRTELTDAKGREIRRGMGEKTGGGRRTERGRGTERGKRTEIEIGMKREEEDGMTTTAKGVARMTVMR